MGKLTIVIALSFHIKFRNKCLNKIIPSYNKYTR